METSSKILLLYYLQRSQNTEGASSKNSAPSKILLLYELLNCFPVKTKGEIVENTTMKKERVQKREAICFVLEKMDILCKRVRDYFVQQKEEKNTLLQVSIMLDRLLVSFLENNEKVLCDNEEARCIHKHVQNVMLHCKDILFNDSTTRSIVTDAVMKDELTWWRFIILLALFLSQIDCGDTSKYSSEEYAKKVVKYLDTQNGWGHLESYLKIQTVLQEDFQDNLNGVVHSIVILAIFLLNKI